MTFYPFSVEKQVEVIFLDGKKVTLPFKQCDLKKLIQVRPVLGYRVF